jgi:hypothetical protein
MTYNGNKSKRAFIACKAFSTWNISTEIINLQMVPKMPINQFHHSFEPKRRRPQQLLSIF